jgi:hypothetical protein
MKRIPAALALSIALSCGSSAHAACSPETQCDGEHCDRVEICDDTIEMTRSSSADAPPMSTGKGSPSGSPVAAAVADAGCREVDICGTTQLVCD